MKRKIKFRAWNNRKNMFEKTFSSRLFIQLFGDINILQDDKSFADVSQDYILNQFTGLIDKNSVEIYEDDKVIYTLNDDSSQKEIEAVVEWHKHAWRLNRIWLLTEIRNIKVVGNVHEAVS